MQTHLLSRRTAAWEPSTPFDVPSGDGSIGLRWDGDSMIGVLAVTPPEPVPIRIGAPASGPCNLTATVAAAVALTDAAPTSIDIVSHTMGCWGDAPAARAYRSVLGDLRIAAHRSVHLVVRIRPADLAHAVLMRGGDGAATLRATLWCLRRVRARLAEEGVSTSNLTAAQITGLTSALTEGAPVTAATESRIGMVHNGFHLVPYALTETRAEVLAGLLAAPVAADAISTTVTVRLSASPTGPVVQVAVRDNGGRAADRTGEHGLALVADGRRAALALGLSIGPPPRSGRRDQTVDDAVPAFSSAESARVAATVPVPLTGDGQLIGADSSGRPVTLRLVGRDIARSEIIGDDILARQTVARLAALGICVAVISDDPRSWTRLADTAGAGLISIGAPQRPVQAIVDDTANGEVSAPDDATVIRRGRRGAAPPGNRRPAVWQTPDGSVVAEGGGHRVEVGLVSTAAERALLES